MRIMSGKTVAGIVLLVMGIGLAAASLLADSLVAGGRPGTGIFQIIGAVAGGVVALAGLVQLIKK
jgi:hypothetical protein